MQLDTSPYGDAEIMWFSFNKRCRSFYCEKGNDGPFNYQTNFQNIDVSNFKHLLLLQFLSKGKIKPIGQLELQFVMLVDLLQKCFKKHKFKMLHSV